LGDCLRSLDAIPLPRVILRNHIVDIAKAQLSNTGEVAGNGYFNVFKEMRDAIFRVGTPTATFKFQGLNQVQRQQLATLNLSPVLNQNDTFTGSPEFTALGEIFKMSPLDARNVQGTVTADAYYAFSLAWKGVALVTAILDKTQDSLFNARTNKWHQIGDKGKAKVPIASVGQSRATDEDSLASKELPMLNNGDMFTYDLDMLIVTGYDNTQRLRTLFHSGQENFMEGEGITLPYFDGMVRPDKSTVVSFFETHLFRGLGKDYDTASRLFMRFRNGMRAMANHPCGQILAHVYKCLDIAMKTGSRVALLTAGPTYLGCVINNTTLRLRLGAQDIKSQDGTGVIAERAKLQVHDRALAVILTKIRVPEDMQGLTVYDISLAQISTSRGLATVLATLDEGVFEPADYTAIFSNLKDLRFDESFPAFSRDLINVFLNYVLTGNEQLLAQYPAFIDGGYSKNTGRVAVGLTIFGPRAPTLNYGPPTGGQQFTIPFDLTAHDTNLDMGADGKRNLQYLPFKDVSIAMACINWSRLFADGVIRIPAGRQGKKEFSDTTQMAVKILGPDTVVTYDLIKRISNSHRTGLKAGNKRAAPTVASLRGNIKKQKIEAGVDADDM